MKDFFLFLFQSEDCKATEITSPSKYELLLVINWLGVLVFLGYWVDGTHWEDKHFINDNLILIAAF